MNHTYHIQFPLGACRPDILQAAEIAMLLGFHSVSQHFPVVGSEPDVCTVKLTRGTSLSAVESEDGILLAVPEDCLPANAALFLSEYLEHTGRALDAHRSLSAPEAFAPAVPTEKSVQPPPRDWRTRFGLERLFDVGSFFKDTDGDLLADQANFHVTVPANPEDALYRGILDLAYRMGMETTAYTAPIFRTESCGGTEIRIVPGKNCAIRLDSDCHITLSGSGEAFAAMCSRICGAFPVEQPGTDLTEYLCSLAEGWNSADGQLAAAFLAKECFPGSVFYAGPELLSRKDIPGDLPLKNYQELVPVFEKEYDFPWENDVLKNILKEKLSGTVKPGDSISIFAAVSENKTVRAQLRREVEELFPGCQADILCAYKQGFSWMEEWILPRLKEMDFSAPDSSVTIAFKPFLPKGVTEWGQETGGAVPSYYGGTNGSPDKWLDLPIRFLQELYPIDDILCRELGLAADRIRFVTYDGTETYQVTAVSGENRRVWQYDVPVMERCYLDDFPNLGQVHPAVGYVKVSVNGTPVINETFPTDTERLWDVYQQEILPAARAFVDEKCGKGLNPGDQPLFAQLRLEASLSEPDEVLPTREDLLSSLDALHEDLYFAGSDYFKNCGLASECGLVLDAPGLILPVLHQREGAPQFRAALYERRFRAPCLVTPEGTRYAPWNKHDANLVIREIRFENDRITYVLDASAPCPDELSAFLAAYGRLLAAGKLEANNRLLPGSTFLFEIVGAESVSFTVPETEKAAPLDIRDIFVPGNELIGYDRYIDLMEQLKRVPQLHVYPLSHSCEGRVIYGVEVASKRPGYLSRAKRISRNISEMLTARHHANEVSSTNAAFLLIRGLLTEEAYAELPEWLNLVIIPMLNVDGSAIHYELQKEHPKWKFHVARYNALGREYGREWFVPDTIHTEALAHRKLWWQILPDIEVDNHGVPSHEWEQPFSGYTSPSFKGFWLPRSLLYGYFWYVTDPEYKDNLQIDHRMEEVIADAVNADPQIRQWNAEWMDRFETYAHRWMPGLFPADYYRNMINYWVPYPYTPGHTYDSVKFPWITTVCYTSEVADETAQGEYLALCARTHLIHDRAILALLREGRSVYRHEAVRKDNTVFFSLTRQRPALCLRADER